MTERYARLTDRQWDEVKGFLPVERKRNHPLRAVFDAIRWLCRTGAQWRNLDSQFPPWKSVHYYFNKWSRNATLETINDALNRQERQVVFARADSPSLLLVDSQSVRLLPRIKQDRGIDGGKFVNGRKRSILTDTLGRVWRVAVHAANVHDGVAGEEELIYPDFGAQMPRGQMPRAQMPRAQKLLADSAYDKHFRGALAQLDQQVSLECSQRDPALRGFVVQPRRWVVERTFAWWNYYRRIVRDYERTVENSAGFVFMANIQMVLSSLAAKSP